MKIITRKGKEGSKNKKEVRIVKKILLIALLVGISLNLASNAFALVENQQIIEHNSSQEFNKQIKIL